MKFDDEHQEVHQAMLDIAIARVTKKHPDVIALYVFGSFGTSYEKRDSDIDLAFFRNIESDNVETWHLAQEIASAVDKDIDLIDLQKASTVFRYQIFTTGTLIYCQNDILHARFENLVISMYLRFQEERKEILKLYSSEDKKYG